MDLGFYIDTASENFLLEEPGLSWYCYGKVALDMILTSQHLPSVWFKDYGTLAARTLASADTIEDYTCLACGFDKGCTGVDSDLPAVRLKGYIEVFHLPDVVQRILRRTDNK